MLGKILRFKLHKFEVMSIGKECALLGAVHKLRRHLGGGGVSQLSEGFYCKKAKIVYVGGGGGVKISWKVST